MAKVKGGPIRDLFSGQPYGGPQREMLGDGAVVLRAFAAPEVVTLLKLIDAVLSVSPFRQMLTPGGFRMSVALTNCGRAGWVSDLDGYRYSENDPITGRAWPTMPNAFVDLGVRAAAATGYGNFQPDVCIINRYEPGARLTLHQDKNERDLAAPIVSLSLGLPAVFLFGGLLRTDKTRRVRLESGDIAVWGGPSRLAFHGILPLEDGDDPLTGRCRINMTFRKAL